VSRALAVVLGAACALALACGGGSLGARSPASPAPGAARGESLTMPGDARAEIEELDRQITEELAGAQVAAPAIPSCSGPACAAAVAEPFATPTTGDSTCHPAATPRCTDVCKLGDSVCHNQERICELAAQLAGDDWAANKCTGARASCKAAHERCCSCAL